MVKANLPQHTNSYCNLSLNLVKTGRQTTNCRSPRLITEEYFIMITLMCTFILAS